MKIFICITMCVAILASPCGLACDLCSTYAALEAQGEVSRGFFGGVAEQFTHFGTVQDNGHETSGEGQYIDSSVSQLYVGYNFNRRFSAQVNVPLIYRSYGSDTMHGKVSGVGDVSLIGNFVAFKKLRGDFNIYWTLLGGVKFPTGGTSKLNVPDSALPDGIGGHDLALGSGSFDGLVGTSVFMRWKRLFMTAGTQYAIRSEGDFGHQYANDLTWNGGPGAYLALKEDYSVALQLNVSGETKGKDDFNGVPDEDSSETIVALGPQFNLTLGSRLSAQLGADFPVNIYNSGTQVVPDYRIRAAINLRF